MTIQANEWRITTAAGHGNGTSLQIVLDELTIEDVEKKCGPAPHGGYWDEDAGYDGTEWRFVGPAGEAVILYTRWSRLRIGAHSPEHAERFRDWLCK